MTIKPLYPSSDPTLDLNFAAARALDPRVTFTRDSIATRVGPDGLLQTVAPNVARFDHSPTTRESLGLLVEEARTNSIRNNTMVGAVAGTPGTLPTNWPFQAGGSGLSVSIVGTGTESGISYLDWRVSGTASANVSPTICFDRATAATGQAWTTSSYVRLAAGSLTGVTAATLSLIEETSGAVFVTGALYSIPLPTSASLISQRSTATRTLSGGATVGLIRTNLTIDVSSGSTVDVTLRIGLPQLEQGAFATSPILTSTATVTRAADVASITGANFTSWYNQAEGTFYGEFARSAIDTRFPATFTVSDNTRQNEIYIVTGQNGSAQGQFSVTTGNVLQAYLTVTGLAAPATNKVSGTFKLNDFIVATNGALSNADTSGTIPTVDRAYIGLRGDGAASINGTIKRLTYWPTRLPNAMLQAITS
jgi:hypothetical protein